MVFVGTGCVGKPKKAMPRRDGSCKGGSSGDSGFKKEGRKHLEGRRLGFRLSLGAKGKMHWGGGRICSPGAKSVIYRREQPAG